MFAVISPFLIEPRYVPRVWGVHDLRPWFDYTTDGDAIGEVWLTGDECRVASGAHAGERLGALFAAEPKALLGDGTPAGSPLLLKVIYAKDKLSVQVHPDDTMAQKYGEPRGKTECWYTLAAEPGAKVALGLKPGVTLDQVRSGIADGTLEKSLGTVGVVAGDMVYVDAGTVHAIWPGSVLLETQQYSDTTYRLFDYGRPRELHVEKGLEATRLATRAGKVPPEKLADRTVLVNEGYFCVERIKVESSRSSATLPGSGEKLPGLSYLFAAAGTGRITSASFNAIELPARGVVAVPAASPQFAVQDMGGLDLIRISPRWP